MIHTATLVHDDILDEAMVRRHAATVNAEWGNETAVLLGDYLFTHAFHLAASLDSTRACRWIGHATNKVCEGEMQQVHHRGNLDLDEAAYFAIIEGKTAELTAVSCRLGASYAGAPESTVAALDRYGRDLGIAFQIADDVLDIWGEERVTGKSLGTDLEKQKLTLPVIYLLRLVEPEAAAEVRRLLAEARADHRRLLRPYLETHRRHRPRLAVRQAPREAGPRRPGLPPRFGRQGRSSASSPSTSSAARRDAPRDADPDAPSIPSALARPDRNLRLLQVFELNLAIDPLSCFRVLAMRPLRAASRPIVVSIGPAAGGPLGITSGIFCQNSRRRQFPASGRRRMVES